MPVLGNLGTMFVRDKDGDLVPVPVIRGENGITPHIGENGNWFIGDRDTGIPASGVPGEKGDRGEKGDTGENGVSVSHEWNGTVLTVTSASGTSSADLKGAKGEKGDTGERGPKGDKGDTGAQGEKGEKGEKGDTGKTGKGLDILGTYATLEALKSSVTAPEQGDMYNVGSASPYTIYMYDAVLGWVSQGQLQGAKGTTFTPAVDADGNLTWTNDGGLANPAAANIRGPKGAAGEQGPQGEIGPHGSKGDPGVSATHSWNGTVLTVTSASGTSSADLKGPKGDTGETGAQGPKGEGGNTPQKGTDYFTAADKQELVDAVLAALPAAEGVDF